MSFLLVVFLLLISPVQAQEEKPAQEKFELLSPAFKNNDEFPEKYTCKGGDINPPLEIKNLPSKTKALALTFHDPDAPEGVWVHWVVYNLPPDKAVIAENTVPQFQALNDFGKYNYSGPCPSDDRVHHYTFRAYALSAVLDVNEGGTMKDLEKAMGRHILAKSELVATYRKALW